MKYSIDEPLKVIKTFKINLTLVNEIRMPQSTKFLHKLRNLKCRNGK